MLFSDPMSVHILTFRHLFGALPFLVVATGCVAPASVEETEHRNDEVNVDTNAQTARSQYDANVAFATSYTPRCTSTVASSRPRVLLTGFGRFMNITNNATGRIVSRLVPSVHYPETQAPAPGALDPPGPQLSVSSTTVNWPEVGEVDVCAMILPVYWDLAAILIAKEAEAFLPTFVMMNGVAGGRQPLWIELGATNYASYNFDGSNRLRPAMEPGASYTKIVESAPSSEDDLGNLLSWHAVEAAAQHAVDRHADELDGGESFASVLQGAVLAGFPRPSNTYLCNNVTYAVNWLMDHPNSEIALLRASTIVKGSRNVVYVKLTSNLRHVPRVFVHWPSELADKHHEAAADVMKSMIVAQLWAAINDPPTLGDNALAAPSLQGGSHY